MDEQLKDSLVNILVDLMEELYDLDTAVQYINDLYDK